MIEEQFGGRTAYEMGHGPLLCDSCGRILSNDPVAENAAEWTPTGIRLPYCADSDICRQDVLKKWSEAQGGPR